MRLRELNANGIGHLVSQIFDLNPCCHDPFAATTATRADPVARRRSGGVRAGLGAACNGSRLNQPPDGLLSWPRRRYCAVWVLHHERAGGHRRNLPCLPHPYARFGHGVEDGGRRLWSPMSSTSAPSAYQEHVGPRPCG